MTEIDATTFKMEVRESQEDLSPARAGLLFARECAYPELRPSDYLVKLDDLAMAARRAVPARPSVEARAHALAEFLFEAEGFHGNTDDYYDPRNSYLNEVLDRRLGIPISLSVVYIEVGRRLGLPVMGVGMPGHFIAGVMGEDGLLYFDPYHGGASLSVAECERLIRAATKYSGVFNSRWLEPTAPREVVARMLNNLRLFYVQVEDWTRAIAIFERLRELQPAVASHLRDLGVLHYRRGSLRAAFNLLDQYLARQPDAPDADAVRTGRDRLIEELARLN